MVVRFDNKALQQTLEHKKEPIGVEGDPASTKKGGMSEADAIVQEARKSLPDASKLSVDEHGLGEEKARITREIIREEEEKEVGPEIDTEGLKNVSKDEMKTD